LATVTVRTADVVEFPAASRARAVSWWVPFAVAVVSQEVVYGAAVSSPLSGAPSSRNCTPTTPTASVAVAPTDTVPETVAPGVGALMSTTGGVVSGAGVVAGAGAVWAERLPAASRARTV
jgi:hypothetical protein